MSCTFTKDPDAVLDYTMDWEKWLATGDTISASAWTFPTGITKDSDTNTATTATARISAGTAGTDYAIVNRITTDDGRIDDRTITILVRER